MSASQSSPPFSRKKEEKILKVARIGNRAGKYFFIFLSIFIFLGVISGMYFLLPSAEIILTLKTKEKNISSKIEGNLSLSKIDIQNSKIPARLEKLSKKYSGEFESSGSVAGAEKAKGKAIIYNEYSANSQPLVATTRLESPEGKIFRITKNVIVPGFSKIDNKINPGTVEVEVIADKPGTDYNIEPTVFKIPGFSGSPKYDKFYAKSEKAMEGGTRGESLVVTDQDIANAKEDLIKTAKKELMEELKKLPAVGRYYLENTIQFNILSFSSSKPAGSKSDKFTESIEMEAQIISFLESDVKELISGLQKNNDPKITKVNFDNPLNYILIESNIEKGILVFELKTDLSVSGGIDVSEFKKRSLGKNINELEELIKNYPDVKSASLNLWPFYVKRIPSRESRIKIEIQ